MNFDQTSRNLLEESLGYERVVLKLSIRIQEEYTGIASPLKLILNDTPPHEMHMELIDSIGGGQQIAVVRSLAALLFVTAFKLLDMVLEWVLWQNGRNPNGYFWTFKQKAKELGKGGLTYPDFLATEPRLAEVLESVFLRLWPHRNAVVHGSWGREAAGNLCFDFVYQDLSDPAKPLTHIKENLAFGDLMLLAEFASRIAEHLVTPHTQSSNTIDTLRWLCDKLGSFHGSAAFGINRPRHFEVVRRTSLPKIDAKLIRGEVGKQAGNQPFSFRLTIEQINPALTWEMTDLDCAGVDVLQLNDLDPFKK